MDSVRVPDAGVELYPTSVSANQYKVHRRTRATFPGIGAPVKSDHHGRILYPQVRPPALEEC